VSWKNSLRKRGNNKQEDIMEKRVLGKTGLEISVFAFGGIVVRDTAQDEANRIVAEAIDGDEPVNSFV
jgi:hypothetical protein